MTNACQILDATIAALKSIAESSIPDCPTSSDWDDLVRAQRHVAKLRDMAEKAAEDAIKARTDISDEDIEHDAIVNKLVVKHQIEMKRRIAAEQEADRLLRGLLDIASDNVKFDKRDSVQGAIMSHLAGIRLYAYDQVFGRKADTL